MVKPEISWPLTQALHQNAVLFKIQDKDPVLASAGAQLVFSPVCQMAGLVERIRRVGQLQAPAA